MSSFTEEEQEMALIVGDDLSAHLGSGRLLGSARIPKTVRSEREARLKALGFEDVSAEQCEENLNYSLFCLGVHG